MEQNRTEEKQELEHLKKDVATRLTYQKATIKDLQKELKTARDDWRMCDEALDAKQQELNALRKEVKQNAN